MLAENPTLRSEIHGRDDATAVIIPSKPRPLTVTYRDLRGECAAFQRKLAALGLGHGAPVSIATANSYEFIVAFLATAWQRAVAAPLNPAYKQDEFEFYIDDVKSALILVPRGAYAAGAPAVRAAQKFNAAVAECYWDAAHREVALDVKELGQLKGRRRENILEPQADDVALVLHTRYVCRGIRIGTHLWRAEMKGLTKGCPHSGTTSRPKVVSDVAKPCLSTIERASSAAGAAARASTNTESACRCH